MSSRDSRRTTTGAQTLDILYDISLLMNAQLDKDTLATCVSLIESGVNPETLAMVVKELKEVNLALLPAKQGETK